MIRLREVQQFALILDFSKIWKSSGIKRNSCTFLPKKLDKIRKPKTWKECNIFPQDFLMIWRLCRATGKILSDYSWKLKYAQLQNWNYIALRWNYADYSKYCKMNSCFSVEVFIIANVGERMHWWEVGSTFPDSWLLYGKTPTFSLARVAQKITNFWSKILILDAKTPKLVLAHVNELK